MKTRYEEENSLPSPISSSTVSNGLAGGGWSHPSAGGAGRACEDRSVRYADHRLAPNVLRGHRRVYKIAPTLKELLNKYEDQVRLAYRDFPLNQIHPQAQGAAEASRCAGEQGKFWEYHDRVFTNQAKLDVASLTEHAQSLKLDGKRFDECLKSGKFKAAVEQDLKEGTAAGVSGTPVVFVNGVFLSGTQPAAVFEKTIKAELAAVKSQARAGNQGNHLAR